MPFVYTGLMKISKTLRTERVIWLAGINWTLTFHLRENEIEQAVYDDSCFIACHLFIGPFSREKSQ